MSASPRNDFDPLAYNPRFAWRFLAPKYWGTWLLILLCVPLSLLPHPVRYGLVSFFARFLAKKRRGAVLNVRVNLALCFPEKSEQEREAMLLNTLITAGVFLSGFAQLTLRSKAWLNQQCEVRGLEHITEHTQHGKNVILLVPHWWAIDIPAILLASKGMPVSAMAKKQKNEVLDWLMHRQRVQYGGRVYERDGGVKPFIKSVRDGYLGYYLPDQDHGREHSIFVDFCAATKATLPGLGKVAKVSRAEIVPVFARFDAKTGRYIIDIHPAFSPYPTGSEEQDARMMNAFIEQRVGEFPEQYMWILRLLRTQPDGTNYYRLARQGEFPPRDAHHTKSH